MGKTMAARTQDVQWTEGRVTSQASMITATAPATSCSPTADTRCMRLYAMQVVQK